MHVNGYHQVTRTLLQGWLAAFVKWLVETLQAIPRIIPHLKILKLWNGEKSAHIIKALMHVRAMPCIFISQKFAILNLCHHACAGDERIAGDRSNICLGLRRVDQHVACKILVPFSSLLGSMQSFKEGIACLMNKEQCCTETFLGAPCLQHGNRINRQKKEVCKNCCSTLERLARG